jgi:hypothetical protein
MSQNEWANYTIFNDIKGFVNKEVSSMIQEHHEKKSYNVMRLKYGYI